MTHHPTHRATRVVAGWALVPVLLAGCAAGPDEGGDDVTSAEASTSLEQHRTDARAAATDLVTGAVEALAGRATATTGRFLGCESASERAYRSFRYTATGRVDAAAATPRPYLAPLAAVLTGAGFGEPRPGERPGGRTLVATRGDLTATFAELPGQGAYVLLTVDGPCVEPPEAERDAWLRRTDPEPYL